MERAEKAEPSDTCGGFGVILRGVCFPCRRIVKAALGYAGIPRTRDFSFQRLCPIGYQQFKCDRFHAPPLQRKLHPYNRSGQDVLDWTVPRPTDEKKEKTC